MGYRSRSDIEESGEFILSNISLGRGIGNQGNVKVYLGFNSDEGTLIAWNERKLSSKVNITTVFEEGELLRILNHKNVIKGLGYELDRNKKYINMFTEYCSSGKLIDYVKKYNLAGNKSVIRNWCRQIVTALHYLHSNRVYHGDLCCEAIYINGNTSTIKIGHIRNEARSISCENDIYMFGIRVVPELANSEYRFKGKGRKNLISSAFDGLHDLEIIEFVRRCTQRQITAQELLNDPFLAIDVVDAPTPTTGSISAADYQNLRETVRDQVAKLLLPTTEVVKDINIEGRKFRLQGKLSDHLSTIVAMKLIIDGNDTVQTIDFDFILRVDTILDILKNMDVEFNSFVADEFALVSEIMEQLVTELQDDPHDRSIPCIAVEDWCLQDLFLEESSSNNTSDDVSSTHETSNDAQAQGQASTPSNISQQNQDTERQQMQSGRRSRRRGNRKLS